MSDNTVNLKYLVNNMDMAFIVQDRNGKITEANPSAEKILGYKKQQLFKFNPGKELFAMLDREGKSLSWNNQPAYRTYKTGKKYRNQIICIRRESKEDLWLKLNTIPIFDRNKKPVSVASFFCDITDQKNNEDLLLKYKIAFDYSTDCVLITDRNGHNFYHNRAFTRLFGKPSLNAYKRLLVSKKVEREMLTQISSGKTWTGEAECYGKNGKIHIIKLHVDIIKDRKGNIVNYFSLLEDITKQKQIQEELKISQEKYETLVESQSDFVSRYLPDSTLTYVNDAYCKFFGKKREELIGQSYLFMIAPEYRDNVFKENKKLASKGGSVVGEYLNYRSDGKPCWIQWAVQCICDSNGDVRELQAVGRDLTERKQIEENLRNSEENFRQLAERLPSAIYILQNDVFVYLNQACKKYLGKGIDRIAGKPIAPNKLIPKDFLDLVRKNNIAQLKEKDVPPFESIISDQEGNKVNVLHSTIILNYHHQPAILGKITDITEQKKLESAIRESEKRFRSMIENSTEGISLLNSRGETIYVTPSIQKLTGYESEYLTGKSALNNIHPEDRDMIKKLLSGLMKNEGSMVSATFRSIKKDGTIWWTEGTAVNRLHDPDISAIITNYRDITARKQVEDRLWVTQFGIDHADIAIFQLDDTGKIYFANEQACNSLGYTRDEMYNLHVSDFNVSLDSEKWKKHHWNKIAKKHLSIETTHRRKDGSTFPVEVTINVIEYEDKKLTITFAKDISERKKAEKALREQFHEYQKLNKQYEEKNAELLELLLNVQTINEELEEAKVKAEESDKLKTAFLANMSHEIRTPMNGILGFTELLKSPEISGTDQSKYLDIIQQSGERMLKIINDLVDISKIEAGQVDMNLAPISVNKIFDSLYEFFLPEAEKINLILTLFKESLDDNCIIEADEVKLTQVISNLIKNALKYTHKGEIQIGYKIIKDEIIIHVKDTGIGISKEQQEKIFERFVQGDPAPGGAVEGSGLGLAISKAYIELMKGKIWFESEYGNGSVFYISLPFNKGSVRPMNKEANKSKPEELTVPQYTILIAEDDNTSYYFLEEVLKKQNFRLIRVTNGKKAVELITTMPDIRMVLMDVKMPEMNGLEATKLIKAMKPDTPVIIQTAYASGNDKKQAVDAGCDDFIVKPINREMLLQIIKKHIKKSNAEVNRN